VGITDLFKPKYRHSDVRVRSEAVRALTRDDADTLIQIARTDRDPTVRRIAIEKLEQAEVLATIAKDDSDRAVRDLAGHRAAEIWTIAACGQSDSAEAALAGLIELGDQRAVAEVAARATRPPVRKRAFDALREPRALAELARTASSPEVRLEAISRISDQDVLRGIAVDSSQKDVGLAAVERIHDAELLEAISHKAKAKQVRQRARKKVNDLEEAQRAARPVVTDEVKRRRAEHAQLLRQVENAEHGYEWNKSLDTVHDVEKAWQAIGAADDPAIEERFQKALRHYYQRREVHEHQVEEVRHHHDAEARAKREAAERAEAERAARAAARAQRVAEEDVVAVAAATDPAREARKREAEEKRAERDKRRAEDEARKAAEVAERAARAKEDAERGKAIAASLAAMAEEMEALAGSTDVRAIDRVLGQSAKAFEQLGKVPAPEREPLGNRYGAVRAKLVIQIKDLRDAEDWQRWANVPRQEALIKEAQAMFEAEATPDLGQRLKDLQSRWKTVGPVPQKKSKELWDQFKSVCDQVYGKVKTGRDAEKERWAQSAAGKEQLIAAAEALADSTDWETTAAQLKALQQQWKESGPLPRKQADELWKRFRAACDRFFERRKPMLDAQRAELVDNLERKQALCARAEAVVAAAPGDDGWGPAINEIKALQRQWKEIGFVPRRDADAVYKRFRAACDALFDKRDQARDAEAEARRAEVEAVRTEVEAVLADAGGTDAVARAVAVRGTLRELAERDAQPSIELAGLVDRMLRAVITAQPDATKGTELDPEAMRARREKLLARAEALAPRSAPTLSGSESPAEIAAKLKSALKSNALGGLRMDRDPVEVVEELAAEWQAIGPVVGEASEALAARFDEISAKVLAAAGAEGRPARRDEPAEGDRDDGGRRRRDRRERRRVERSTNDAAGLGEAAPAAAAAMLEQARAEAIVAPAMDPVAEAAPEPAAEHSSEAEAVTVTMTVTMQAAAAEPAPSEPEPVHAADLAAHAEAPAAPPTDPLAASPRKKSITDPPPPDIVDDAWDVDDHRPQAAPPEPEPPAAGEMAGDGATEGEGLDTGWD